MAPRTIAWTVILAATASLPAAAQTPNYSAAAYTVNGGSETVAGGAYQLSASAGQPLTGASTGGGYSLTFGLHATTTSGPGAPTPDPLQPCPNEFAEVSGGDHGERLNRFGCVSAPTPPTAAGAVPTTIRVTYRTLYNVTDDPDPDGPATCPSGRTKPGLDQFEGRTRYLGPPVEFIDESSPQNRNYIAAPLVCDAASAAARDWSPSALAADFGADADTARIYFYGPGVVPCSAYAVSHCDQSAATCNPSSLPVYTALLADTWSPFNTVNVTDITKLVDKFRGNQFILGPPPAGAPPETRALLRGNLAAATGKLLNVTDITNGIDGFRGLPYKEQGPCDGTGVDECGNPCNPAAGD